jgi:hypothetical protein
MTAAPALRSGWTIARSMWQVRQPAFLALVLAPLLYGWFLHMTPASVLSRETSTTLGSLLMGLSLFLTFVCCNFTENDRRERLDGFPARLFTLPVATGILVAAPLLFSALAIGVIYVAWARLALPATGQSLPLAWPLLYLITGILCYQSAVWTLARWRAARLIVLGTGGTLLAVGWLALLPEFERDLASSLVHAGWPLHRLICTTLLAAGIGAWAIAQVVVGRQRRGELIRWSELLPAAFRRHEPSGDAHAGRTVLERLSDLLARRRGSMRTPAQAQCWFEWRRHGSLLPLTTGAVLVLIMAPAPFSAPLSAEITGIALCWMIALPLLLAFVLGKGFGKADLWSKEPGPSLFHATRPLSVSERIGAKLKAAALATVSTWGLLLPATALWLWLWCDWPALLQQWRESAADSPNEFSLGSAVMAMAILILCTWRFLIGSLYLGMSAKPWLMNLAGCGVFLSIFAPLLGTIPQLQERLQSFLFPPAWFRWLLIGLFAAKVGAAAALTIYARRQRFVKTRAVMRYIALWLLLTTLMIVMVRPLVPLEFTAVGWNKRLFTIFALFFVPLLRISYAPIALGRSRRG